jgi:hypothetical protein
MCHLLINNNNNNNNKVVPLHGETSLKESLQRPQVFRSTRVHNLTTIQARYVSDKKHDSRPAEHNH